MDFGLATAQESTRLTRTGNLPGTLAYLSPEQVLSLEVDGRSDLYSLGVIGYEFLAGRPPHLGAAATQLYRIVHEPVPSLDRRLADPRLIFLIEKCLAKDPAERYATGRELAAAVRALLRPALGRNSGSGGRGPGGTGPSARYRLGSGCGPRRAASMTERFALLEPGRGSRAAAFWARSGAERNRGAAFGGARRRRPVGDRGRGSGHRQKPTAARGRAAGQAGAACSRCTGVLPILRAVIPSRPWPRCCSKRATVRFSRPILNGGGWLRAWSTFSPVWPKCRRSPLRSSRARRSRTGDLAHVYEVIGRTLGGLAGGRPLLLLLEEMHAADASLSAAALPLPPLRPDTHPAAGYLPADRGGSPASAYAADSWARRGRSVLPPRARSFERARTPPTASPRSSATIRANIWHAASLPPPKAIRFSPPNWCAASGVPGELRRDDAGQIFFEGSDESLSEMPATLQQALEVRIEKLPERAATLLQLAAVLGRSFPLRDLETLAEEEGLPEIDDTIDLLLLEQLLEEEKGFQRRPVPAPRRAFGGHQIRFSSGLLCHLVGERLSRRRRRRLHQRVALILERRHSENLERVFPAAGPPLGGGGQWRTGRTVWIAARAAAARPCRVGTMCCGWSSWCSNSWRRIAAGTGEVLVRGLDAAAARVARSARGRRGTAAGGGDRLAGDGPGGSRAARGGAGAEGRTIAPACGRRRRGRLISSPKPVSFTAASRLARVSSKPGLMRARGSAHRPFAAPAARAAGDHRQFAGRLHQGERKPGRARGPRCGAAAAASATPRPGGELRVALVSCFTAAEPALAFVAFRCRTVGQRFRAACWRSTAKGAFRRICAGRSKPRPMAVCSTSPSIRAGPLPTAGL